MGKNNLRGEGEQYQFSPDMLEEYFKCAEDIIYFAHNYFYVVSIDEGKNKINLYEYQKKALKIFTQDEYKGKKNAILLLPRQMGKCFFNLTKLDIRNKKTGEIMNITAKELWDMMNRVHQSAR